MAAGTKLLVCLAVSLCVNFIGTGVYGVFAAPAGAEALANEAVALMGRGSLEDAISLFTQSLELEPRAPLTWINLGVALSRHGRHERALGCYDNAEGLGAGHRPDLWINRAIALRDAGRTEDAHNAYTRAITLDPTVSAVHYNHGNLLKQMLRPAAAMQAYVTGLALDDSQPGYYTNLANLLHRNGNLTRLMCATPPVERTRTSRRRAPSRRRRGRRDRAVGGGRRRGGRRARRRDASADHDDDEGAVPAADAISTEPSHTDLTKARQRLEGLGMDGTMDVFRRAQQVAAQRVVERRVGQTTTTQAHARAARRVTAAGDPVGTCASYSSFEVVRDWGTLLHVAPDAQRVCGADYEAPDRALSGEPALAGSCWSRGEAQAALLAEDRVDPVSVPGGRGTIVPLQGAFGGMPPFVYGARKRGHCPGGATKIVNGIELCKATASWPSFLQLGGRRSYREPSIFAARLVASDGLPIVVEGRHAVPHDGCHAFIDVHDQFVTLDDVTGALPAESATALQAYQARRPAAPASLFARRRVQTVGRVVSLMQMSAGGYYHWLTECLCRLVHLRSLLLRLDSEQTDSPIHLLVPGQRQARKYVTQAISLLLPDFPRHRVLFYNSRTPVVVSHSLWTVDWHRAQTPGRDLDARRASKVVGPDGQAGASDGNGIPLFAADNITRRDHMVGVRFCQRPSFPLSDGNRVTGSELFPPSSCLRRIRDAVLAALPAGASEGPEVSTERRRGRQPAPAQVVFVSRAGTSSGRELQNRKAVLQALTELEEDLLDGTTRRVEVEVFTGSRLSLVETAELFAAADVVVGVHGAGLANTVFCRRGAAVVEIALPEAAYRHYRHQAAALDLHYVAVATLGYNQFLRPVTVEPQHVAEGVRRALMLRGEPV